MPQFDGTGPRGRGAMTGRGEGYCVMELPEPADRQAIRGYAGLQGAPLQPDGQTSPATAAQPRHVFGRRGRQRRMRGQRRRQPWW